MNPLLASIICGCGIAFLFWLDRDLRLRPSRAVWLPTIWLAIVGSRATSAWLHIWFGIAAPTGNVQTDGSPLDAAVYAALLAGAIGVLVTRGGRARKVLMANWPILLYFIYCLISVSWSSHPDISLKRWIKAIGDLAMVLVLATDRQPTLALKTMYSRLGFVLLPSSLLLIKYYPYIGRGFTPDGVPMNTGVTTDKNVFGVVLLVISLGTVWKILALLRDEKSLLRRRRLIAQFILLAFGIWLLYLSNSQTSTAGFILGSGLILITGLRSIRKHPNRIHVLCGSILLLGVLTFFAGGGKDVANAMGRKANLSGRTDIWAALIPAAYNPLTGAGFESFWISPHVKIFQQTLAREGWYQPDLLNEAHDGYLEVYLELGIIGVVLIAAILLTGYRRAVAAYRINPHLGGLLLAYLIVSLAYNITEAGFRMLDPIWIFLLFAIVTATGMASGVIRTIPEPISRRRRRTRTLHGRSHQFPPEPAYTLKNEYL